VPARQPDPRLDYVEQTSAPLSSHPVGQRFTVRRIPEELEFAPGLLEFLEQSSLRPGCTGVVTAASPDGTLTIEIDGRHVGVGAFASERILVAS
jgi:DtxR family transcriptional regulator, Mn-dependent transcriptional regulator